MPRRLPAPLSRELIPLFHQAMSVASVLLLFLLICVFATALALAEASERKRVALWCALGFLCACAKVWAFQQTPQWWDVSSDSRQYQLHAQALALHWQGVPVDAVAHKLHGFLATWSSQHGQVWTPDSAIAYTSVLGTYEWLYAATLGGWRLVTNDWLFWGICFNAAMAAIFPVAAYSIARDLGASTRVAAAAALLSLVDPSSGVHASWLLKDTMSGFFAVTAVWAVFRTLRAPSTLAISILTLSASGLASVRFVGYVALVLAIVIVVMTLFKRLPQRSVKHLCSAVLASLVLLGAMYSAPQPVTVASIISAAIQPMQAGKVTLHASEDQNAADLTVVEWRKRLREAPLEAIVTSAARTLFAPFPWVAFTHGVSGTNSIELYYPGMVLWMLCLPGIFIGFLASLRSRSPESLFLACMLLALLGAYTVFMGEWSTRQRVFMLPVFFGYAAIGWHAFYARSRAWIAPGPSKKPFSSLEP